MFLLKHRSGDGYSVLEIFSSSLNSDKQTQTKGATMEELRNSLVTKIGEQLALDKPDIRYLDVLNRLLGTVSNWLIVNANK